MANLVICCDGTWNTPDQVDHGVPNPTNVVLLYNAVAELDGGQIGQQKYYHPGVGTDGSQWNKLIGGGTGKGLDLNIISAYRWLCEKYQPGHNVYLFGFSRGAYTVRSLSGLVSYAGLLDTSELSDADKWQRIDQVFQQGYRRKIESPKDWNERGWKFLPTDKGHIPIHFIGVWDTVGALGIPDDMALLNMLDRLHDYTFHDTTLSPAIRTARHAIALDEMRASFQPTLWTAVENSDVKQAWFSGVHADVGGGYPEAGLSNLSFEWMVEEAKLCGLAFNTDITAQIKPNPRGVLHDSCTGAFTLLPTQPRSAPQIDADASVHPSVKERQAVPPITQCPYRQRRLIIANPPIQVDVFARQPWNSTGIWLDAGTTYSFSSSGEWLDGNITCGPDGCNDGNFQLGEVAQFAGTVLGKAEGLFRAITGNTSADFRFTRRHEDMPWFGLVGAIANGTGVDGKGHLLPHESFFIGRQCQYKPRVSGYFYAFANDAWNCYGNNRGSIQLCVIEGLSV
jgi:uncharacterized protein (DUF2235 family)